MSELLKSPNKLIVVHGLGPERQMTNVYKVLTRHLYFMGVEPLIPGIEWKDGEDFQTKSDRLLRMIRRLYNANMRVFLAGTSAGGSLVLDAFLRAPEMISGVVTLGSPFREWAPENGHDLEWVATDKTGYARAFVEGVKRMEDLTKAIPEEFLGRIMTMRALKDEIIPEHTSTITGATNISMPSVSLPYFGFGYHAASIGRALAQPKPILDFLLKSPGISY